MTSGQVTIDGQPVPIEADETILQVAARVGIHIPTLCHVDGVPPAGGCRLCLVQTHHDGRLQAACHTRPEDGMEVQTTSDRLDALRRDILALILQDQPDRHFETAGWDGLRSLVESLQPPATTSRPRVAPPASDESHAYLRFRPDLCITCRRCVNVCAARVGQFVFGIAGRGHESRLIFGASARFSEGPCTACGACVDECPTGAISDRDRQQRDPAAPAKTRTVCAYCGVGCRVEIETVDDRVARIRGVPEAAVNRGELCVKGRYAHAYHHAEDRLTSPLVRDGDTWRSIGWDEAIRRVVAGFTDLRDRHGPDALGVMTSSRASNESAYLLQKLFRAALGTNNVDCCARVCHASTALALQIATGTGAASASYDDLERARCIVVAGANPTEAHPVIGARIKQAVLRGASLVVIDPRRIELAEYANVHLALRPGTNVAVLNALAALLIQSDQIDRAYVDERTEGFDDLVRHLQAHGADDAARLAGISPADLQIAADVMGAAGPCLFVTGLGLSESVEGTASVLAASNLGMLTGSIGRPGAGMLPLRGQNNVQGNADMGGMPNQVTGYQPLDDADVRARVEVTWGAAPPITPGLTIPEMIDAAAAGGIRGLWIQGEDIAQSDPHQDHVLEALDRLDLLVVQELFLSETARRADVVLPAAGALESEGTFTNGERRIQLVQPAVAPPGEARPDWEAIRDVGIAMGQPWSYTGPGDVMDEIARVAPALFGGVAYDRLDPDGLQWPCPSRDHPGTSIVHADGFVRGRGRLVALDPVPSPEHDVEGYPYLLMTGRVLDHYNVGTMTRRTPSVDLEPADVLEMHPDDAGREGIETERDAEVEVESRWGSTRVPMRLSRRVRPGTVFLSFHFPRTHANRLVGPHVDPDSKCPDYKVTAVRIRPAAV